jgi:hypothetical protein
MALPGTKSGRLSRSSTGTHAVAKASSSAGPLLYFMVYSMMAGLAAMTLASRFGRRRTHLAELVPHGCTNHTVRDGLGVPAGPGSGSKG